MHNFAIEVERTIQRELNTFGNMWNERPSHYWGSSDLKRMFLPYKFNFYIKQNWLELHVFDKEVQGSLRVDLTDEAQFWATKSKFFSPRTVNFCTFCDIQVQCFIWVERIDILKKLHKYSKQHWVRFDWHCRDMKWGFTVLLKWHWIKLHISDVQDQCTIEEALDNIAHFWYRRSRFLSGGTEY